MPHLLEPLTVGTLHLHNRLVMPPMATSKANADGSMSDAIIDYYAEKSRGGAIGLVITEHCYISPQGRNRPGQPSVADDAMLPGLKRLAATFHENGSKAVVQINHAGAAAATPNPDFALVSASAVSLRPADSAPPQPLDAADIEQVVRDFADAALRVKQAGFDGAEIHAAHGYLLNQFFSPLTNKRADHYGGDLLGRIRIHLEVIAAVREAVGPHYPVLLRLGARDYMDGGTTIQDSVAAAVEFERAGIDAIDITGGLTGYMRPDHAEPGYFAELSEPIKQAVSIPVILTGGVTKAAHAEELLASGVADLIGVGRAILADSGWATRAVAEVSA